jgi:hypothetical protein
MASAEASSSACRADTACENTPDSLPATSRFGASKHRHSVHLAHSVSRTMLRRFSDPNILPYLHVTLSFLYHTTLSGVAMDTLLSNYPWEELSVVLNTLAGQRDERLESVNPFPVPAERGYSRPLPEDFALRGMPWARQYFPGDWFSGDYQEDDYKGFDCFELRPDREARIIWLGLQLARRTEHLDLDATNSRFAAPRGASSFPLSHHAYPEASTSFAPIPGPSSCSPSSSRGSGSTSQAEASSQDVPESKAFCCDWQDCSRAFKRQGDLK